MPNKGGSNVQVLDQEEPVPTVRKKCTVVLKLGTMDDADFKFGNSNAVARDYNNFLAIDRD